MNAPGVEVLRGVGRERAREDDEALLAEFVEDAGDVDGFAGGGLDDGCRAIDGVEFEARERQSALDGGGCAAAENHDLLLPWHRRRADALPTHRRDADATEEAS